MVHVREDRREGLQTVACHGRDDHEALRQSPDVGIDVPSVVIFVVRKFLLQ
nr:hypothetical protein [Lentilactobacillus otakiensis]